GRCSERSCASGTRTGTQRKSREAQYVKQLPEWSWVPALALRARPGHEGHESVSNRSFCDERHIVDFGQDLTSSHRRSRMALGADNDDPYRDWFLAPLSALRRRGAVQDARPESRLVRHRQRRRHRLRPLSNPRRMHRPHRADARGDRPAAVAAPHAVDRPRALAMTRDFDIVPALSFPAAAPSTADNISAALSSIDAAGSALRPLAPL